MDYTTPENNLNAPDYDPSEFAPLQLLEQGDVDVWVRRRGAILLEKSRETAKECEAGKLASAITVGASVVMSANPLAWVPMVIGAVGYVYTVFQEFQDTGSIRQQGRVTLFDPTEPEHSLFLIHSIWILYDHRRRLPESERPSLPPVRLILADWLSVCQVQGSLAVRWLSGTTRQA